MPIKIKVHGNSISGKVRRLNEDSFSYNCTKGQKGSLFIVCDGVGGHKAGEIASKFASRKIQEYFFQSPQKDISSRLKEAVIKINKDIYTTSQKDNSKKGMGTTLVAAFIYNNKIFIANVGDSRAYLSRNNNLKRLTRDNSWVEEKIRDGVISPSEARNHPKKNIITRCIGYSPDVIVDTYKYVLKSGDRIILCSDGLWGELEDYEIKRIIYENRNIAEAVNNLIQNANTNGGKDNITCIGMDYGRFKSLAGINKKNVIVLALSVLSFILIAVLIFLSFQIRNLKKEIDGKVTTGEVIENEENIEDELIPIEEEITDNIEVIDNQYEKEGDTLKEEITPVEGQFKDLCFSYVAALPESQISDKKSLEIISTSLGNVFLFAKLEGEGILYCYSSNDTSIDFKKIEFLPIIFDIKSINNIFIDKNDEDRKFYFSAFEKIFSIPEDKIINAGIEGNSIMVEDSLLYPEEWVINGINKYYILATKKELYSFNNNIEDGNIIWEKITYEDNKNKLEGISEARLLDLSKEDIEGNEILFLLVSINDKNFIATYKIEEDKLELTNIRPTIGSFNEDNSALSITSDNNNVYILYEDLYIKRFNIEKDDSDRLDFIEDYKISLLGNEINENELSVLNFDITDNNLYLILDNLSLGKICLYKTEIE